MHLNLFGAFAVPPSFIQFSLCALRIMEIPCRFDGNRSFVCSRWWCLYWISFYGFVGINRIPICLPIRIPTHRCTGSRLVVILATVEVVLLLLLLLCFVNRNRKIKEAIRVRVFPLVASNKMPHLRIPNGRWEAQMRNKNPPSSRFSLDIYHSDAPIVSKRSHRTAIPFWWNDLINIYKSDQIHCVL